MTVVTYKPSFTVQLTKIVKRQQGMASRYNASPRQIDLTPYLGESAGIQISKDVYRPDGSWQISFGDQPDPTTMDTLYALIEPMDIIEIRGSRTPFQYAGKKLPLLMRGFISGIRRSESMNGGEPQRSVIIRGGDFGRLWLIHGVWTEVMVSQETPLLSTFQLQAALGIAAQVVTVQAFMQDMVTKVINRKIQEMAAFAAPATIPQFTLQGSVTQGIVVPQAVGLFPPGPFWNIVKNFADAPWNEVWVDDSDAVGPALVFRPAPYKDISGNWIGGAADPGKILLDYADVMGVEVGRSDERCANFFWVPPGQSLLDTPNSVAAWDILQGNPFDFNHPNNEPQLYGYRKMEFPTQLYPNTLTDYPINQTPAQVQQSAVGITSWHVQRGKLLQQMNEDNVVLEDSIISARGREDFRPGKYVEFTRNKVTSEAYITRISHNISIFSSWTTTLATERGTGFLKRNQMAGSPYWAEGRPSSYGAPTAAPASTAPSASTVSGSASS